MQRLGISLNDASILSTELGDQCVYTEFVFVLPTIEQILRI